MDVVIKSTQEEFESKRPELIHKIAGGMFDISLEKSMKKRPAILKIQDEMLDYWDREFQKMIRGLKKEIEEVLG